MISGSVVHPHCCNPIVYLLYVFIFLLQYTEQLELHKILKFYWTWLTQQRVSILSPKLHSLRTQKAFSNANCQKLSKSTRGGQSCCRVVSLLAPPLGPHPRGWKVGQWWSPVPPWRQSLLCETLHLFIFYLNCLKRFIPSIIAPLMLKLPIFPQIWLVYMYSF